MVDILRNINNPNPSKKAILRGNSNDREYLYSLVNNLNHLGYEFGCVAPIISGSPDEYGYLVSLADLSYLVDRISESVAMPKKNFDVPEQGKLFTEDSV